MNKKFIPLILVLAASSLLVLAFTPIKKRQQNTPLITELLNKLKNYNTTLPEDRVYLQLDKPFYKPGETIYFAAHLKNAADFKRSKQSDIVHVELISPKGNVEKTIKIITKDGIAKGDFLLAEEAAGGLYKIKAWTEWMKNDPNPAFFTKEIQVQKVVLPRLKMELDFQKEAYGSGDLAKADLTLNTNSNTPLANQSFRYIASIDGKQILTQTGTTNEKGEAMVSVTLPKNLATNDGLLNVMIDYQGITESISRSIPILLNEVELAFFPEGGDLVAGINGRVAFRARNEYGKPADIEGTVFDSKGIEVAKLASYHQGMGAFELKPDHLEIYTVKIDKPVGCKSTFQLPDALPMGYGMEIVGKDEKQLIVNLKSTHEELLTLITTVRGEHYSTKEIKMQPGTYAVQIPTTNIPIGVAQLTLFDSKCIPRAERLAFVNKHQQLQVKISTDKEKYLPREKVKLTIQTTDERGMPMPANLSLAVSDDQLLTFADDKSSNILSWMLTEADLAEEVHEPKFYFDPKEEKADLALDYLLMTSGWRRYTWKQIEEKNPLANVAGERSIIGGTVLTADGKPYYHAKVSVLGTDYVQLSDANGNFQFGDVALYSGVNLQVEFPNNNPTQNIHVNAYKNDFLFTESIELTGLIRSDGEPIPFANVTLKGTNQGTTTDFDGNFKLPINNLPSNPILVVSYIGYDTKEVVLKKHNIGKKMNIRLEGDMQALNEVVVSSAKRSPTKRELAIYNAAKRKAEAERSRVSKASVGNKAAANKAAERAAMLLAKERAEAERVAKPIVMPPPPKPEPVAEEIVEMEQEIPMEEPAEVIEDLKNRDAPADDVLLMEKEVNELAFKDAEAKKADKFMRADVAEDQRFIGNDRKQMGAAISPQILYYRAKEFAAPAYPKQEKPEIRNDFRSTIYWNGHVDIDRSGKKTLEFYNSDAISSFKITAEGFGTDGSIGRGEQLFYTQLPFSISAKIPVEVVQEDLLKVPVTFVNNTDQSLSGDLAINIPTGLSPVTPLPKRLTMRAKEASTQYFAFKVTNTEPSKTPLSIGFSNGGFDDAVEQKVNIVPKGFPSSYSFSGQQLKEEFSLDINDVVKGSLEAKLTAYPSTVSELMSGLESMLREPHGCFEQTSSSTYPNILVLQYMEETDQINKEIASRARNLIKKGYNRLISFESSGGGFEWFGGNPAHEGLTAYGLMEFIDMQKVYEGVDDKMVARTKKWLLSRRDGNGLYKRNPRALHSFGLANNESMSAYITWALTEAGHMEVKKDAEVAYNNALKAKSPYLLGLAANIMYNFKETTKGKKALDELLSIQLENGNWNHGKQKSAPGSTGNALAVETASLALLALLKQDAPHGASVKKVADFILKSRNRYGGFGNTNSTVLALKSLIEYAKYSKRTDEDGTIAFYINNKKVAEKSYKKGVDQPIIIDDLAQYIKNGKQKFKVEYIGCKTALPYSIGVNWNTTLPNSSKECQVGLKTKLDNKTAKVGATVRLTTELTNKTTEGLPMTIAILGIPAGLSPQPWQLKELTEKKLVDFYEVFDNRVVFYYRQMKPSESKTIHLDLKADIPGKYEAPASSAYLYYTNEHKEWASVNVLEIRE